MVKNISVNQSIGICDKTCGDDSYWYGTLNFFHKGDRLYIIYFAFALGLCNKIDCGANVLLKLEMTIYYIFVTFVVLLFLGSNNLLLNILLEC